MSRGAYGVIRSRGSRPFYGLVLLRGVIPVDPGTDTTDDLLLESGDFILLENGDKLLLE